MSDDGHDVDVDDFVSQAKATLGEIKVIDWNSTNAIAGPADGDAKDQDDPRAAEAAELIRQIEYYFSEDNLPHDKHLLGMFQEGNGDVSLNEVCGFKAMRKFKPKTWVREVLETSNLLELCGNGKRLRRKLPLQTPLSVVPKLSRDTKSHVVPDDQPWMTKSMMKPTGFEEGAEKTITDKDAEQDVKVYDPEIDFTHRMQTAIAHFCARRKMHQDHAKVFDKFLTYGGFRGGQAQFVGGVDGQAAEELSKKERAEQTARYDIDSTVRDGLDSEDKKWWVAFETAAKGFFSSAFFAHFPWDDKATSDKATGTIRNFYNYLLTHNVCPEYKADIEAAIEVCNLAAQELPKMAILDKDLPGGFNVATSMLFGGHHSNQNAQGGWAQCEEGSTYDAEKAWAVFKAQICIHGTQKQITAINSFQTTGKDGFICPEINDVKVGLEIVEVEMPDKKAMEIYNSATFKDSLIKPMGKIHCTEWRVPFAPPADLPEDVRDARNHPDPSVKHVFLIEVSTLEHCFKGCKFEATIKYAHPDLIWIDYFEAIYPSFHAWLPNEVYREWKAVGPPTDWMERQNAKKKGVTVKAEEVPVEMEPFYDGGEGDFSDEEDYDDEEPD